MLAGSVGLALIVALVMTAVTITTALWWSRKIVRQTAPVADSETVNSYSVAQATILKVWDTGVTLDHDPQVGLLLEIRPFDQPDYQIETKAIIPRSHLRRVQPGANLPVTVDPQNPVDIKLTF